MKICRHWIISLRARMSRSAYDVYVYFTKKKERCVKMQCDTTTTTTSESNMFSHTHCAFLIQKTIVHAIRWRALTDKRMLLKREEKERNERVLKNEEKKDKALHSVRCNADTDETADKKKISRKKII